jgi:hypothetical protein
VAHAIIGHIPADLEATRETLRLWIARRGVDEWRTRSNASASEVLDLLDFTPQTQPQPAQDAPGDRNGRAVDLPILTPNLPTGMPRGFRTVHPLEWTVWKGEVIASTEEELLS